MKKKQALDGFIRERLHKHTHLKLCIAVKTFFGRFTSKKSALVSIPEWKPELMRLCIL